MAIFESPQTLAETNTAESLDALAEKLAKAKQQVVVSGLSKHIDSVWKQVREANRYVRRDMIKLLQRCRGEYDTQKLAAIRAFKGSELYIRTGENKCRAAVSWIHDIYRGETDLPWSLEPTALPDLPNTTRQQIKEEIFQQGMALQQQMIQSEQPVDPNQIAATMQKWQEQAENEARKQIDKDAKKRCKKAEIAIRDQNQEGGWASAFKDFTWYFARVKAGIIKGPGLIKKPKQQWTPTPDGSFTIETVDVLATDVYCVSPFNFFPVKNMAKINDGDVIEIHELSKQSLADLIGVPGYSEENIRLVLARLDAGTLKARWIELDDELQVKQVEKEKYNQNTSTISGSGVATVLGNGMETLIQAMEYYGTVSGKMLAEWGTEGVDVAQQYQANCWKIDEITIKAVVNPDSLGRKPYHVTSWCKNPAWIWGEGLMETAAPIEEMLNAIARALQNNVAIASGPQVEVNKDRCDDKTPLYPWKRWESTTSQMKDGPAVNFWQPQMHVQELIQAWEFFSKVLDEMTVPAYAQGASQSGVTAGTATVFTQLLAAASRSIKDVVSNIDDDIITPYIQMCYDYLMKFSEDDSLKGDARAIAKGVAGLLAKEQEAQRKVEFLQVVANPAFTQILGAKNIGYMLAQIAKANNFTLPDIDRLEGNETIEQLLQAMLNAKSGVDPNQMTGQIGAGGTPVNAQNTTADGRPAGAPEFQ